MKKKKYKIDKFTGMKYEEGSLMDMAHQFDPLGPDNEEEKERFPPLTSKETGDLIHAVGDKCEKPNCNNEYSLEVHHIIPRSKNGTNKLSNLIVLCPNHHKDAQKGRLSKEQIKAWIRNTNRFKTHVKWKW